MITLYRADLLGMAKQQNETMKKILTNLMAAVFAVGLIAFLGCDAVKEDPDAVNMETGEKEKPNPEKLDETKDPEGPGGDPKGDPEKGDPKE